MSSIETLRSSVFSIPYRLPWRPPEFPYQNLLLTTLAQVSAPPFNQQDWTIPKRIITPQVGWIQQNLLQTTLAPIVIPFSQSDWPIPQRGRSAPQWWQNNLLVSTLAAVQMPFNQYDWPRPIAKPPVIISWEQGLKLNLLGQDTFFGPPGMPPTYNWPLPPQIRRTGDPGFFSQDRLLNLLAIIQPKPFAQYDWPLPKGIPYPIVLKTWIDPLKLNLLGKDTFFGPPGMPPAVQPFPIPKRVAPTFQQGIFAAGLSLLVPQVPAPNTIIYIFDDVQSPLISPVVLFAPEIPNVVIISPKVASATLGVSEAEFLRMLAPRIDP